MDKQSSMSEYKNKWILDLVTQENQWQNTDFRNNAVIFASLDLQFCLGSLLLFNLSFSCHKKCLALYSVFQAAKHSSEELSCGCSEFKALLALVTRDSCGTPLAQCPASLCGADLLLARGSCWQTGWPWSWLQAKPLSTARAGCWGRLEAGRREQGSVCNGLVLLLNTLSKGFCYWPWWRMVCWAECTLVQICCVCSCQEHIKRKI